MRRWLPLMVVLLQGCGEPLPEPDFPDWGPCAPEDPPEPCYERSIAGNNSYWGEAQNNGMGGIVATTEAGQLRFTIDGAGTAAPFVVLTQTNDRATQGDSYLRLHVKEIPSANTSAQLLFGLGVSEIGGTVTERVMFGIEEAELYARRDIDARLNTNDEFTPMPYPLVAIDSINVSDFWLEIREQDGTVYWRFGEHQEDLDVVQQLPTPFGVLDRDAKSTIQVGRYKDEVPAGTEEVVLAEFCDCPIPR